jgi:hypothetical protein
MQSPFIAGGVAGLVLLMATGHPPAEAQAASGTPRLSFLAGECKAELDGVDIGCQGKAIHTQLDNGRNLINFPARDIATIGFAGQQITGTGSANAVLRVDRVYINRRNADADGQCSIERATEGAKLECRALYGGKRLTAVLQSADADLSFLQPSGDADAGATAAGADCSGILKTHGFLSRAQFQCGFGKYSEEMTEAARTCRNTVGDKSKDLILSGMQTFDRNEKERGRSQLCRDVLSSFAGMIAK